MRRLLTRSVSPLGWTVLGFAVVSLALFVGFGWKELLMTSVFGGVVFIIAILLSLGNTEVDATLRLTSQRVRVGENVTAVIALSNPGRTPTAKAQARVMLGPLPETFTVPGLRPHKTRETSLTFTPVARAVLSVGPLTLRKGDPFGLITRERDAAESVTLYVHPETVPLGAIDSGIIRDLEGEATEDIVDDDLSFYGLRDYQPGDDIRNIHWLTTAKTHKLEVRQFQATRKTTTSLSLGLNPADYRSQEEFELAISAHASIGAQCLMQRRPLTVHTGSDHLPHTSVTHFLDACSALVPDSNESANLAGAATSVSPDASLYVFTVGALKNLAVIKKMMASVPRSASALVLQVNPEATASIRRYDGFTLATVTALPDVPRLLEAAQ